MAGSQAVLGGGRGGLQARARHWAKHCSPEGFIWAESSPPSGLPVGRRLLYCLARAAKKGDRSHFGKRGQGEAVNKDRLVVYFVFF